MILVDANLLVYAHDASSAHHDAARQWLEDRLNGSERVGLPWATLLAFVRLATSPRIYQRPLTIPDAWSLVDEWLSLPRVWIPEPTTEHRNILSRFFLTSVSHSRLVPDAHLAALSIGHGLLLCSADGDFARFPGLRWQNPLVA